MLKKNWLLSKGERRDFVYLTIGKPPKIYVTYGYINEPSEIDKNSGAIDMIPYWEWEGTDGIFRKWYLTAFMLLIITNIAICTFDVITLLIIGLMQKKI